MEPQQLSRELREGKTPDLERRRQIIGLSMVGATMAQLVSLYQTGVIDHLPDPPVPFLNADKVDASNYAYRFGGPDGPLMLVTYGMTAYLASAGGENRAKENPLLPIAMGLKILFDAITSTELAREEWSENKAFCEYCQIATLCSYASLALAMPEITTAVHTLLGQKDDGGVLSNA
ncbi:vitamin K epoxide reductase family protein [Leptolyngbya sp. FACHB-261]|uniref:vitamin K epoxide reductase family protein n=1 Tax=Leptolyngbya sp. FACHB-261 TaxID=2692806 RepID=UPI001685BA5F|nr:vitamin K epoxide reductase family protein [Leptolyngbya sp. FACHB-261]MBD2100165.1 vitamin K epoxide reductase family protein [Leptolyngbya sp. FACHB-261]